VPPENVANGLPSMLNTVFVAPGISHCISINVVCALHGTGDCGPVNRTTVNVEPGTDEVVLAGATEVVAATLVLVVGASVVVVDVFADLPLLLLQAASSTASSITERRIRTIVRSL
jgi:hypothetical protein